MPNRLPQIFLNNSAVFESATTRKKQGGIFELNLKDKQFDELNSTFTAGFKDKHFKTSINKKIIKDAELNYRTIPLRVSQYDVPKEKRLLTGHFSLFRSAKVKSFSLEKNPQTCQAFHSCEEERNVNSIIANRRHQLEDLELKMAPLTFVADEYRKDLQAIMNKFEGQIGEIESGFTQIFHKLRTKITELRKETGNEQKRNKIDMEKYQSQLKMYQQMASDFPQKMERIQKTI